MTPDQKVYEALEAMSRYRISGLPWSTRRQARRHPDEPRSPVLHAEDAPDPRADDRREPGHGPEGTTLEQAKELLHKHRIEKLPVVDAQFRVVGLITVKDIQKQIKYPFACKDELGRLRVGAALGIAKDTLDRAARLVDARVDLWSSTPRTGTARVSPDDRDAAREIPRDAARRRQRRDRSGGQGADRARRGRGARSASARQHLHDARRHRRRRPADHGDRRGFAALRRGGVPLIADGGIKFSGDIVKALAAGANAS
jgi:IMP dehydrogenase